MKFFGKKHRMTVRSCLLLQETSFFLPACRLTGYSRALTNNSCSSETPSRKCPAVNSADLLSLRLCKMVSDVRFQIKTRGLLLPYTLNGLDLDS